MKRHTYFPVITGIFCACLIVSNILDTKFFQLGSATFPAGIILFPLVYVFGDLFTEVYGYAQSRKAIWAGFASLLLAVVSIELARRLPAAESWHEQEAFNAILGKLPRIVLASIIAYFTGEFLNSFTLAKLKVAQRGSRMAVRFVASTIVGQAADTAVFIIIAFAGTIPISVMGQIFLSAWAFKVLWEVAALPVSLPLVRWLKRVENEDYFDKDTNFSPFKLS